MNADVGSDRLLAPEKLEAELRAIGAERYHVRHPFHHLLHGGKLTRAQVQAWALNRYYYQATIPVEGRIALARLPTPELRREWRRRLVDHDGDGPGTGRRRTLAGADRRARPRPRLCRSPRACCPARASRWTPMCNFVRERSCWKRVASSLTEMFSPDIIAQRVSGMLRTTTSSPRRPWPISRRASPRRRRTSPSRWTM